VRKCCQEYKYSLLAVAAVLREDWTSRCLSSVTVPMGFDRISTTPVSIIFWSFSFSSKCPIVDLCNTMIAVIDYSLVVVMTGLFSSSTDAEDSCP
jgi:hypothetical protein